jgi:hypothetical protein
MKPLLTMVATSGTTGARADEGACADRVTAEHVYLALITSLDHTSDHSEGLSS